MKWRIFPSFHGIFWIIAINVIIKINNISLKLLQVVSIVEGMGSGGDKEEWA